MNSQASVRSRKTPHCSSCINSGVPPPALFACEARILREWPNCWRLCRQRHAQSMRRPLVPAEHEHGGTIKKCGNERQTGAPSRVSQSPPEASRHRKGTAHQQRRGVHQGADAAFGGLIASSAPPATARLSHEPRMAGAHGDVACGRAAPVQAARRCIFVPRSVLGPSASALITPCY